MDLDCHLPKLYNRTTENVIVMAHRGASAYYPENTMPAFKGALAMNAEIIELDVMMSKDGVPVVFHDVTLYSHTNGKGLVKDYTLAQLKELDAGSWFREEFAGEQIPTLEEVLDFAAGQVALNIEIKTEAVTGNIEGGIVEKSLQLIKEYGMEDHVMFSSFDYLALEQLRRLDKEVSIALLYDRRQLGRKLPHELIKSFSADAFNCYFRELSQRWIDDIETYDIPLFVYTLDNSKKMRSLINSGVTGIFTNKPDLLAEVGR